VTTETQNTHTVAVIGAGPAGLFAARELANAGVRVALLNRDIRPGGLAEYGIYYDKYKMKVGLRRQFQEILAMPGIDYFGNVTVGTDTGLSLDDLREMGFQALVVTVGAQGTKWLGLPGEDLQGVYHAKDIVYHYNDLPPFSAMEFHIGRRVALIGVGNVMMDIAHWTVHDLKVDEVIAVARRGPAEVKFTKKEMQNVGANLDLDDLDAEIARVADRMKAVDQDPQSAREFILSGTRKALEPVSDTKFRFRFLSSPCRIIGDDQGRVVGLEVEDTKLVLKNGVTKARGLGTKPILDVDTVVFCIGDKVDDNFGLPIQWNAFVKNPEPQYPVDDVSFEAYDHEADAPIEGVFVAGWSREASSGLVGVARKDGEKGAQATLKYLEDLPAPSEPTKAIDLLRQTLDQSGKPYVTNEEVTRLDEFECAEAGQRGVEIYKLKTNQEMLDCLTRMNS
jgi:ferredoxin--NADP+ reductase